MALLSTPNNRTRYMSWNTLCQYIGLSMSPGLAIIISLIYAVDGKQGEIVTSAYAPSALMAGLYVVMMVVLVTSLPEKDPMSATAEALYTKQAPVVDQSIVEDEEENKQRFADSGNIDYEDHKPVEMSSLTAGDDREATTKSSGFLLEYATATDPPARPSPTRSSVRSTPVPPPLNDVDDFKTNCAFVLFFLLNFTLRGIMGVVETFGVNQYETINASQPGHKLVQEAAVVFTAIGAVGILTFFVISPLEKRYRSYNVLIFGMILVTIGSIVLVPPVMGTNMVLFCLGVTLIWAWGGPICQTLTISAYSQMLGTRPQGTQMGWLTTAGSIGRIVFPLMAGASYTVAHVVDGVVGLLSIASVVLFAWYFQIQLCGCFGDRRHGRRHRLHGIKNFLTGTSQA